MSAVSLRLIGSRVSKLASGEDAPREEVAQVDELAVALVLDVDDTVAVAPAADGLAVDDDVLLATDDGKRNHLANAGVERELLGVVLDRVVRVESDRVVRELCADLSGATMQLSAEGSRAANCAKTD